MRKTGLSQSRRKVIWKNLNSGRGIVSTIIATALGAGFSPVAPGTAGSLVAVPLVYWTHTWDIRSQIFFWSVLTLVGIWAAMEFDLLMEAHDHQSIVVDEVIGMGVASWTAGLDWKTVMASFLVFRIFDIWKLPPVRWIDRWSKHQTSPGWDGFGVIADDIVAGLQALAVIYGLQRLHFLFS